jgi:hypothetical protein
MSGTPDPNYIPIDSRATLATGEQANADPAVRRRLALPAGLHRAACHGATAGWVGGEHGTYGAHDGAGDDDEAASASDRAPLAAVAHRAVDRGGSRAIRRSGQATECVIEPLERRLVIERCSRVEGGERPPDLGISCAGQAYLLGDELEAAVVIAALTACVFDGACRCDGMSCFMKQYAEDACCPVGEQLGGNEDLGSDAEELVAKPYSVPEYRLRGRMAVGPCVLTTRVTRLLRVGIRERARW